MIRLTRPRCSIALHRPHFGELPAVLLAALLACTAAAPATAQGSSSSNSSSFLPYTTSGYVGINLGRTRFDMACSLGNPSCDRFANTAVNLYTGGMFNDYLGLELGYLHTGNLDRAGGRTSAQGVNLLLVGRMPIGAFSLFAKAGGIYGRTEVSADPLSGIAGGSKSGGGLSLTGGLGYDLSPKSTLVVQWARNKFKFEHEGHPNVDTTSVGYVYRF